MKKFKKFAAVLVAVGILGTAAIAYAEVTAKTPAQIVSGLTGKTMEDVIKERADGKTYGTIVNEAGKLDEFKSQILEQKKAILDQRVKSGTLTQQQADQIYNSIKDNQAVCNGIGNATMGKNNGMGFGNSNGKGQGKAASRGMGQRNGTGTCQGNGAGYNN